MLTVLGFGALFAILVPPENHRDQGFTVVGPAVCDSTG